MKSTVLILLLIFSFTSCIPLKIAPKIPDYKTTTGKRFKKSLPKKTMFIFKDPKDANQFYDYINTKFQLNDYYVAVEVPFQIDGKAYSFSFYEIEKKDKTINLVPLLFDVALNTVLDNDDMETYLATDENSVYRKGNYYIAIEVFNDNEKDCLHENSASRTEVLAYLRDLKKEYLATHNYNEVVFKN